MLPCSSCQLNLSQPERFAHPEDSCAARRGRKPAIPPGRDDEFQLRALLTALCPCGAPPVSFRLKLASRRDTGGRIFVHIPNYLVRSRCPSRAYVVASQCWHRPRAAAIVDFALPCSLLPTGARLVSRRHSGAPTHVTVSESAGIYGASLSHDCDKEPCPTHLMAFAPRPLKKAVSHIHPAPPESQTDLHAMVAQPLGSTPAPRELG